MEYVEDAGQMQSGRSRVWRQDTKIAGMSCTSLFYNLHFRFPHLKFARPALFELLDCRRNDHSTAQASELSVATSMERSMERSTLNENGKRVASRSTDMGNGISKGGQAQQHNPTGYTWDREEDAPGYAWKNKKAQEDYARSWDNVVGKDQMILGMTRHVLSSATSTGWRLTLFRSLWRRPCWCESSHDYLQYGLSAHKAQHHNQMNLHHHS